MIDSILTAIQHPFFLRSLLVIIILSVIFPLYWNIVVIRQEANIAHTFAHTWLFWIAIWLRFNFSIEITILASIIITIILIYILWFKELDNKVAQNEILAEFWLVWAILIVSNMSWYKADISSYLFGDILLLWKWDIIAIISTFIATLILFILYQRQWYAISLNKSLAISKNISPNFKNVLYLIGLWLLIGWAMKIIWVLLVSAFLILPSNIWKKLANNKIRRNIYSIIISIITSIIALFLSWHLDMPSWASIIACMLIVYLIVSLFNLRK